MIQLYAKSGQSLNRLLRGLLLLALLPAAGWTAPLSPLPDAPVISIIIDDMGNQESWGNNMLKVPGQLTYAFLPHTPHARRLAEQAHLQGKEVMLHLPMQSHEGNRLGPGALTLHMTEVDFKRTLNAGLQAIPHVRGLNNHMGSLLTQHPGAMEWLMQGINERGSLYFIDSRTSQHTVGQQLAQEYGIANARRDVFLDNQRDPVYIKKQFDQLIKQARKQGYAIAIGHPYPETAAVLQQVLADLEGYGVRLIPASAMIDYQGRNEAWYAPSSHSPKVAKSSKRSPSSICCAGPESTLSAQD